MREAPFLTSCHVHTVPLLHSTPARLSRSFDPFQEGPNPLKIIKVPHSCWLREPTKETSLTSACLTECQTVINAAAMPGRHAAQIDLKFARA